MKSIAFLLILILAAPALAIGTDECEATLEHLATLYELRTLMSKSFTSSYDVDRFVDARIDLLREPTGDGDYRWVRWVRPSGDGPVKKDGNTVTAVQGTATDSFEAAAGHAYSVRIVVPRKRSLTRENNPVYVGTVRINYTIDGRTRTLEEPINQWMNPETSRSIELPAIADRVDVALDAATAARHSRQAIVEVHFRQAVSEDDPTNPAYPTIRALERIRVSTTAATVDGEIAALERTIFPAATSIPLLTIITDLRRAEELKRSSKPEEVEKGVKLLDDTLRKLR